MIVKNTIDQGIVDELVNKIKHLSIALKQANEIIEKLELENQNLKTIVPDFCHA